jgi:DNA-binding NtrC family response regulator
VEQDSTILVSDDDPIEREILESLLNGQGYKLAFASNGMETLEKAQELTPDLILLDIMMPEMDGIEVCRRLRADDVLAEVPVVMVTALDDRDSRLRSIEAGADNFISKPFDRTELLAHVQTITRLNRYRQLVTANQKLEQDFIQLSALYDISSALNSIVDVDELLRFIIRKTKGLLGVERASVMFHDQERDELYFPVVSVEEDEIEDHLKKLRFSTDSGVAGWVFRNQEPALVSDVSADKRFCGEIDKKTGFVTRSVLCVPLHGKEGVIGVLEAVNKKVGDFTVEDQSLLGAIGDNIAVSIEKANLYRDLQKAEATLRKQNADLRMAVKQKYRFENIVGISDKILNVIKRAEQVSLTNSTVIIYGETGTGKELLARAIHNSSPRSSESFIPINCGAIPENLLESELFGHEKGAFTSAASKRIGRFEEGDGGTIFLDEIGDMPINLQVRLLRVLQEGVIQRLGSNQDIPIDVRIITATHQDLGQLVKEEKFRQDLFYRLRVFELVVPPLRERREDIPLLVEHFIGHYNNKFNKKIAGIEPSALSILQRHDYPGNIRELQHIIESAMILCSNETITINSLPKHIYPVKADKNTDSEDEKLIPKNKEELAAARAEAQKKVEYIFLKELLTSTDGNISKAARKAGMNRSWLTELIERHGLHPNQYKNVG